MLENIEKYSVILASASPRRKELFQRLGIPFKVRTLLGIDESFPKDLPLDEVAEYIAGKKAAGYKLSMQSNELIVTADTIVRLDDEMLGKPHSTSEAKEMLRKLSGRSHFVYTGVVITSIEKQVSFTATSRVEFAELSDDEINYYVDNYLPLDKAGSYGIQDWIGMVAVANIEGSYFNVVGMPMQRLFTALKNF